MVHQSLLPRPSLPRSHLLRLWGPRFRVGAVALKTRLVKKNTRMWRWCLSTLPRRQQRSFLLDEVNAPRLQDRSRLSSSHRCTTRLMWTTVPPLLLVSSSSHPAHSIIRLLDNTSNSSSSNTDRDPLRRLLRATVSLLLRLLLLLLNLLQSMSMNARHRWRSMNGSCLRKSRMSGLDQDSPLSESNRGGRLNASSPPGDQSSCLSEGRQMESQSSLLLGRSGQAERWRIYLGWSLQRSTPVLYLNPPPIRRRRQCPIQPRPVQVLVQPVLAGQRGHLVR